MTLCLLGPCLSTGDSRRSIFIQERKHVGTQEGSFMTLCLLGPCLSTGDSRRSIPTAEQNVVHRTAALPRPNQRALPKRRQGSFSFVTVHELRSS